MVKSCWLHIKLLLFLEKELLLPIWQEVEWASELVQRENVNCKLNKLPLFPENIIKNSDITENTTLGNLE
jgi:hypothetical protein